MVSDPNRECKIAGQTETDFPERISCVFAQGFTQHVAVVAVGPYGYSAIIQTDFQGTDYKGTALRLFVANIAGVTKRERVKPIRFPGLRRK